jgi:tRNA (guanine-N7-)-methyltransferase
MRKIPEHVNPLSAHFHAGRAGRVARPDHLPDDCRVEVELGCADAEFSFTLAAAHPDSLVLGLDILNHLICSHNLNYKLRKNQKHARNSARVWCWLLNY